MRSVLGWSAALALALSPASLQAATAQSCYLNACAQIQVASCAHENAPLRVEVSGYLQEPGAFSVTTWQLIADAQWRFTSNHLVQLDEGTPLANDGFVFGSEFAHSLDVNPEAVDRLLLVFGPRTGGHNFYDVALEMPLDGGQADPMPMDVKPGSCPNPINRHKKGVTPIALVGHADLDLQDIDLHSIEIAGVKPLRYRFSDVTTALAPADWGSGCTTEGADGREDLILKFKTAELLSALERDLGRPLEDGEEIALRLNARLKEADACHAGLVGEDRIRVLNKRRGLSAPGTARGRP